jgi:hypothetical protein
LLTPLQQLAPAAMQALCPSPMEIRRAPGMSIHKVAGAPRPTLGGEESRESVLGPWEDADSGGMGQAPSGPLEMSSAQAASVKAQPGVPTLPKVYPRAQRGL